MYAYNPFIKDGIDRRMSGIANKFVYNVYSITVSAYIQKSQKN